MWTLLDLYYGCLFAGTFSCVWVGIALAQRVHDLWTPVDVLAPRLLQLMVSPLMAGSVTWTVYCLNAFVLPVVAHYPYGAMWGLSLGWILLVGVWLSYVMDANWMFDWRFKRKD
jgi:hypothetical protein